MYLYDTEWKMIPHTTFTISDMRIRVNRRLDEKKKKKMPPTKWCFNKIFSMNNFRMYTNGKTLQIQYTLNAIWKFNGFDCHFWWGTLYGKIISASNYYLLFILQLSLSTVFVFESFPSAILCWISLLPKHFHISYVRHNVIPSTVYRLYSSITLVLNAIL